MDRITKSIISLVIILYISCIICIAYLLVRYRNLNVITPSIVDYIIYPITVDNNSLIVGLK